MTWEFTVIYVATVLLILGWKAITTWSQVEVAKIAPEQVKEAVRKGMNS